MISGKIIVYSEDAAAGVIKVDDGASYLFTRTEWQWPQQKPALGLKVTFQPGTKFALKIKAAA